MEAYALGAGEGWKYDFGAEFAVKASEIRSATGAAVMEYSALKGEDPPRHTHPSEDEMFYVLDGQVAFHCADDTFELGTGGFAFLPCGIEHGYTVRSDTPARLLVVTAPPRAAAQGWGGFVADIESEGTSLDGPARPA